MLQDQFLVELIKYIKPHRNGKYFAEHRVVAFRKFGNTVSWDNTVVRHIDGNKINNSSDNIIIGSIGDNNLDHCTARKEMMMWKSIALEFINRYFILNKEINDNK